MLPALPQHGRKSMRCCFEVLTSLFTLVAPGVVLSALAAAIGALVLMEGDPSLAAALLAGGP
jgi:NhaP-type Na+/H+ or K+/H+ antiporter